MEDRHTLRLEPGPHEFYAMSAATSLIGKPLSLRCKGREIGTGRVIDAWLEDGGALVVHVETRRDYPAMFGLNCDIIAYVIGGVSQPVPDAHAGDACIVQPRPLQSALLVPTCAHESAT